MIGLVQIICAFACGMVAVIFVGVLAEKVAEKRDKRIDKDYDDH